MLRLLAEKHQTDPRAEQGHRQHHHESAALTKCGTALELGAWILWRNFLLQLLEITKCKKQWNTFIAKMLLFFLFFLIFRWMHLRCRWAVHTQDESPQVRLQALELISVILQLFLCDPPGVILSIIWNSLLLEPFYWGSLSTYRKSKWHNTDLIKHICKSLKRKTSVPEP